MSHAATWRVFDPGGGVVDMAPGDQSVQRLADPAARAPLLAERLVDAPTTPAERCQTRELPPDGFLAALNAVARPPVDRAMFMALLESVLIGVLAGIQRMFDLFDDIHRPSASDETGHAKPNRAGFDRVATALAARPTDWRLIDDRPVNVDRARRAGWPARRLETAAGLASTLAARHTTQGVSA